MRAMKQTMGRGTDVVHLGGAASHHKFRQFTKPYWVQTVVN